MPLAVVKFIFDFNHQNLRVCGGLVDKRRNTPINLITHNKNGCFLCVFFKCHCSLNAEFKCKTYCLKLCFYSSLNSSHTVDLNHHFGRLQIVAIAYVHLIATVFMTGVIWFVQLVHYPLFLRVGENESRIYASEHQKRTSWIVGPPMLAEGITTLWLFFDPVNGRLLPLIGGLILLKVHLSTIFLQVPKHSVLVSSHSSEVINALVKTNWFRTIGWSLRSLIALLIIV